jgi:hypothetical protein
MEELKPPYVVVVTGPVGYGKSTLMELLCKTYPNFYPVDGDDFLPRNLVLNLRSRRNKFTWDHIIASICRGEVPVVSTGGGALWRDGKKFDSNISQFQLYAEEMGLKVNFITFVPEDLSAYDNRAAINACTEERISRGEDWSIPPETLFDLSLGNKQFVELFNNVSHSVHKFPRMNPDSEFVPPVLELENPSGVSITPSLWKHLVSTEKVEPIVPDSVRNAITLKKPKKPTVFQSTNGDTPYHAVICDGSEMPTASHIPANSECEGRIYFCYTEGYLPFVTLMILNGASFTVWAGSYQPQSVKDVAKEILDGKKTVTMKHSNGKTVDVSFDFWEQPIRVKTYQMIPSR